MSINSTNKENFKGFAIGIIVTQENNNPKKLFTKEEIIETIRQAKTFYEILNAGQFIDEETLEVVTNELLAEISIPYDKGVAVVDKNNEHKPWINTRDIPFKYWERYKNYLIYDKHWTRNAVQNLYTDSKLILDLCGDPESDSFKIKGLVLGDVQSGKTANYTALCNMAADAGYRAIVVLAGIQNNLRSQTQERLDMEFVGRKSSAVNARNTPKTEQGMGVGKYNPMLDVTTLTSVENDFSKKISEIKLTLASQNSPVLFVVKKNISSLSNLNEWLNDNNITGNNKISVPLLLIDDEADNASVNTKGAEDPTAINRQIRKMLDMFSRSTYLAVTATPYANIFIDDKDESDLFPSDFIYALNPPQNYMGAEYFFLDEDNRNKHIVEIDTEENGDNITSILPLNHKKDAEVSELPDDLVEAVYYFLLANVVRDVREDHKKHRSMLVHISRFKDIHTSITRLIQELLDTVKAEVRSYSQKDSWKDHEVFKDLETVWNKFELGKLSGKDWEDVVRNYLYQSIQSVHVQEVNSKKNEKLDYEKYEGGKRVIAVGGQSLSRGLTLEGLMVSYFYRSTAMYDTLMQMGRWFGYRPGYQDLIKIWLSSQMVRNFIQITQAVNELKASIEDMVDFGKCPRDFGLKVRMDPESALIVTARNKMRNAVEETIPIQLSKKVVETSQLPTDLSVLKHNEKMVRDFVSKLSSVGTKISKDDERALGNDFWTNVPSDVVAELVKSFMTHSYLLSYNQQGISEFITDNMADEAWDVVLISSSAADGARLEEPILCGESRIEIPTTESRIIIHDAERKMLQFTKNRRIGAAGQMRYGLTNKQRDAVKESKKKRNEEKGKVDSKVSLSDRDFLIRDRNPIIVLHVVDANYETPEAESLFPKFLFGISLGFPELDSNSEATKTARYVLNPVMVQELIGDIDDSDE